MHRNGNNLNRIAGRFVALVFMIAVLSGNAVAESPLTYESPEVDCDWLNTEYRLIKDYAAPDDDRPAVTKEGVMMTFGMILTAPFALFSGIFGDKPRGFDFSRNPDDIAAAAKTKKCAALLAQIQADKNSGQYPPPIVRTN